jgi:serine/threonine-protein kinase
MQSDRPGAIIAGKYELIRRAGTGGMAIVWHAVTRGAAGFVRPVALKRILPNLSANQEFVEMFVEEARVGSQLQHPNVVQIHDFGRDAEGEYFLVMEWIDGLDLGRYLKSYAQANLFAPWPIVTAVGIEVLRALHAAHRRTDGAGMPAPIFHRDVTPQNILIGIDGVAKLTDFGLARAMDRTRVTHPNVVKGKLAYLAPEITDGFPPSAQSDLFGAAVVLWEAFSSRKLFDGKNDAEVLLAVREAKVCPLGQYRPDLPKELIVAIHGALAADPAARPKTALHLARQLANVLRRVPEPTDASILGNSVQQARTRLQQDHRPDQGTRRPIPTIPASAASDDIDLEAAPSDVTPIPLTIKKKR